MFLQQKTNSYNGNSQLKQPGFAHQFSAEQVQELIKCSHDPIHFIRNYCYIVSLDHGLVKFNLYPYQEKFINLMHHERRVISMQPRQMGKSQTVAAYILWYTLFNDNKTVAILANKATAAREILSRYQQMYENIPLWMQQGVKTWNKGDIELENGSKVITSATSASGLRGKSINLLYVDETAIVPNTIAEEFFTSVYPVVSAGETTKIVLTSTPLGYNHFWKFWKEAEEDINGFVPLRVHYNEHPLRDDKWAEGQRKLLGDVKFNQEVNCEFLGSSYTLISGDVLGRLSPSQYAYQKDGLDIIVEPEKEHQYIIVADTSRGVGGDYSAFTIIDITQLPYMVVGKYRDNLISPLLYPSVIHKVATDYNNAYCLVEINDNGQQIADVMHNELEYENMLYVGQSGRTGQFLTIGGRNSNAGVRTTKQVKRIGCSVFKTLVESNKLLLNDTDVIAEVATFIETRGSYAADDGYHDDLVMTLVLFSWVSNDTFFKELTNINLRHQIFQQQSEQIENELTPFGFIQNGIEDEVVAVVEHEDLWIRGDVDKYYNNMKNSWFQ